MKFEVVVTPRFQRDFKKLAKRYSSLKTEFALLIDELEEKPQMGISLGHNCYKIRLSIASKAKGKAGGARVITYLFKETHTVYLLTMYDKSDREGISDKELTELLNQI